MRSLIGTRHAAPSSACTARRRTLPVEVCGMVWRNVTISGVRDPRSAERTVACTCSAVSVGPVAKNDGRDDCMSPHFVRSPADV